MAVLALPNIFGSDAETLARFAYNHGFKAIDWTLEPSSTLSDLREQIKILKGFEVRFHARFFGIDIAYSDQRAQEALEIYRRFIDLVSLVGGRHLTIHIGLGVKLEDLSLKVAKRNLTSLACYGRQRGVLVSLENITRGWTANPEILRDLVSRGVGLTFDIGHAMVVSQRLKRDLYWEYLRPHYQKVFSAHIYHTETPRGHEPPKSLEDIRPRLDVLRWLPNCNWWVIELHRPEEVLACRQILRKYLQSKRSYEMSSPPPRWSGRPRAASL